MVSGGEVGKREVCGVWESGGEMWRCDGVLCACPQTKQWIADLKMNGDVFGVAFTADSRFMLSIGCE